MNLNMKIDNEEDQSLQYVNRFAINIPSGATAFNFNIVNPSLSNQSFIFNPVNPVNQNIVSYHQQPMAVQSYIAVPTEAEGNIIHSLPVEIPVPVGLPVPAGILQSHNFVNTSIILENEDCDSPEILKSSSEIVNPENEIKINYIPKSIEGIANDDSPSVVEIEKMELSCPEINSKVLNKKLCPLEMSIKAANIDVEFEKCEMQVPIHLEDKHDKQPELLLIENLPSEDKSNDILEVPLVITSTQTPNTFSDIYKSNIKQSKTEITWENNKFKDKVINNDFQESLICEVEEVNDDEDDDDVVTVNDLNGKLIDSKCFKPTPALNNDKGLSSSDESDALPLSVALKLNKVSNSKSNCKSNSSSVDKKNKKITEEEKTKRTRCQRTKKQIEKKDCDMDWSESDDDALNLKRIKNEFNYKCYFEPGTTKSLILKVDDKPKKFVRVRRCCSKKECAKKISVRDQKAAYKHFCELETNAKKESYLINCIEHVQKSNSFEKENANDKGFTNETLVGKSEEKKLLVNTNIQLEIENESNGNQKLSDEIQNAIKESLKDIETKNESKKLEKVENGEGEKNNWNFYIVVERCRKKVCLQFLLKLFQIPKTKIKQLQKKILYGTPLSEDPFKRNHKSSEVWELAKSHLENLVVEECLDCNANPRHRFLTKTLSREDLFVNFKEYYIHRKGREPKMKYNSYKRFLEKETTLSFMPKREGICAECEDSKKQQKRKQNKTNRNSNKGKESKSSGKGSKKSVVETDSEEFAANDSSKRKHLKITIPLKAGNSKPQKKGNCIEKKSKVKKPSKEKSKRPVIKGRDVWSLMLLHLETMPYKECIACVSKKKHRFLHASLTTQALFEDYRKFFLKETNSELGLGFTMYEKYFTKNCNYTIAEVDPNALVCPQCVLAASKS